MKGELWYITQEQFHILERKNWKMQTPYCRICLFPFVSCATSCAQLFSLFNSLCLNIVISRMPCLHPWHWESGYKNMPVILLQSVSRIAQSLYHSAASKSPPLHTKASTSSAPLLWEITPGKQLAELVCVHLWSQSTAASPELWS